MKEINTGFKLLAIYVQKFQPFDNCTINFDPFVDFEVLSNEHEIFSFTVST